MTYLDNLIKFFFKIWMSISNIENSESIKTENHKYLTFFDPDHTLASVTIANFRLLEVVTK